MPGSGTSLGPKNTRLQAPGRLKQPKPKQAVSSSASGSDTHVVLTLPVSPTAAPRVPTQVNTQPRPLLEAVAEMVRQEESRPPKLFRWGPLSNASPDPAWHISQSEYDALCIFEDSRQAFQSAYTLLEDRSEQVRQDSAQLSQTQFDLSTAQARLMEHDHLAQVFSFHRSVKKCARKGIKRDQQSALLKSRQHADSAQRERRRIPRLETALCGLRATNEASEQLLQEAHAGFRQAEAAFRHARNQVSPQLRWDAVGLGLLPNSCVV
eukprot:jgi/Ulvmu1/7269/UM035_0057.1